MSVRPFIPLATRTLAFEWRRFLPCAAVMACAGVLITVQLALVSGIFSSAAIYIEASRADLWLGQKGTQSIELGRPIQTDADLPLRADPDVMRVEPFSLVGGSWWAQNGHGEESVFVSGISPEVDALAFARVLAPTLRARLREPGAVIVDRADLEKIGASVGGFGVVNGRRVHLIAAVPGLRALGAVSVVASLDTTRSLDTENASGRPTYYLARVREGADAALVRNRVRVREPHTMQIWTADKFSRQTIQHWLIETGAGLGVAFISFVVTLAGAMIATQALRAALAPCLKEYATLRAFGVGAQALRSLVIEQTLWLAGAALVCTAGISYGLVALARSVNVPATVSWGVIAISGSFVSLVVIAAAFGATRWVSRLDPFVLLR